MASLGTSEGTLQVDGEGPDGSDKPPPHISSKLNEAAPASSPDTSAASTTPQTLTGPTTTGTDRSKTLTPGALTVTPSSETMNGSSAAAQGQTAYPLPPPDAGTYEHKQPGHTRKTLEKLVAAEHQSEVVENKQINQSSAQSPYRNRAQRSMSSASRNSDLTGVNGGTSSSPSSPTDSDWGTSAPPSRSPSRPTSRAPSVSAGVSGNKVTSPPVDSKKVKSGKNKDEAPQTPSGKNGKTPSVHSDHKFHLKDLLSGTPKLARKISHRSTSSRKSDSEAEGGASVSGKARSTNGESTTSLSKKYGVCQKLAIGKGATSVVRLAHKWDRSEEKLYAIKEFRKRRKNETEKEYVKKLTAEFCISSALHHPNIVETVDLVQDESQHWCEVMEFCPGGDLYAAIKKGGMSPSEVECCFKQILYGVQYLHSQGVAHRDIKPENLFFDAKGHLKIGDYGASTVYRLPWENTVHMSSGLCGSEPYIAPEQFLGKRKTGSLTFLKRNQGELTTCPDIFNFMRWWNGSAYDARLVDIWACGIVYYCLHFQELPWRAAQPVSDTLYAAYAQACSNPLPAISSCPTTINNLSPRVCRSLIRRMLEPDPRQRCTIEEAAKHSWIREIEVCYEVDHPRHVHVSARAMANANASHLGIVM
ncbi:hypothetical protein AX17_006326 [Amanita inopinata Kibby_2008]|nr:hypothetical protein AX17_006326 [Amanita inopinata Kibby_2008]